jgi:alkaline phosphatase
MDLRTWSAAGCPPVLGDAAESIEVGGPAMIALWRRILLILAALAISAPFALSQLSPDVKQPDVKHVILFIGDGMQLETEIATSRYLFGSDSRLSFHLLPYQGVMSTWDVTTYNKYAASTPYGPYNPAAITPVVGYDPLRGGLLPYPLQLNIDDSYFLQLPKPFATDSASAATAWATGYKTDDGNLAWLPGDPPGGKLETIAEILRRMKGQSIGVVSTVPFSHATPAGHVSHNVSRNNYLAIADEILNEVKPEVVIGAGHPGWARNKDNTDGAYMSDALYNEFKSGARPDYVFAERQAGANGALPLMIAAARAASQGKKLFGLYGGKDGHFESPVPLDQPYVPQVVRATEENPLLEHTVVAALTVLKQNPNGFFAMIEQGDIDWAAHANDFGRLVGTTWDLHRAVMATIAFVNLPGDDLTWDNTMLVVTADHSNSYLRLNPAKRLGKGDLPEQTAPETGACPADGATQKCPKYPGGEVTFGTVNHTNELVRVYALGAGVGELSKYEGTWYPCTQIIDNTQLFHAMLEANGITIPSPLNIVNPGLSCGP